MRVTLEQRASIKDAAREGSGSPQQLVIDLPIKAVERRAWSGTWTKIAAAGASLFPDPNP